jgi:hypothetical protein
MGISTANGKLPGALRKSFKNCKFCCGCAKDEPNDQPKDMNIGRSQKVPLKVKEHDHTA